MMKFQIVFLFLILNVSLIFCQDIETGLVAYYPFDGHAMDQSGNNLNGTINGAIPVSDRFGVPNAAMSFDGLDDYIEVADNDLLDFGTGPIAVSLWMRSSLPNGGPQMLFQKGDSGEGAGQFWLRLDDYLPNITLSFTFTEGNPPATAVTTNQNLFSDGDWHHIVSQRFNDRLQLWVDGDLVAENINDDNRDVDGIGTLIFGAQNAFLNGTIPDIHNYFAGSLDDIRFYDRTLSPDEILAVSNTYCPENYVLSENPEFRVYQASNTLETSGNIIIGSGPIILQAGSAVVLTPGFRTIPGALLTVKNKNCDDGIDDFVPPIVGKGGAISRSAESQLKVMPNPFSDILRVEYLLEKESKFEFYLIDSNGKVLEKWGRKLFASGELETLELNLMDLPNGIYYLRLLSGAKSDIQRIVKIR